MDEKKVKIKSQVVQPQANELKQGDTQKFKQEKIKGTKTATWKKILGTVIVTLIVGILCGAIGLYYVQDKTEFWFVIPKSLTKKVETTSQNANNANNTENQNNETTNNTTTNGENQKAETVITMDEAYKNLEELYDVAVNMYINQPAEYFTVDSGSHPSKSETAVELTNYDKVVNKFFTKSGKADLEEAIKNAIIEENDVVYIESFSGVLGIDYLGRVFTKVEISDSEVKCVVKNIYNENYDTMSANTDSLSTIDVKLKYVDSTFIIKKVNDTWKIDEFDIDGMR